MPAPVVYFFAVVAAASTAIIFKHLVYDPHIAPQVDQFIEEFKENRRRRRQGPIGVRQQRRSSDTSEDDREHLVGRTRRPKKDDTPEDSDSERYGRPHPPPNQSRGLDIELEDLVAREVQEWRSPSVAANTDGLRLRKGAANASGHTLDETNQTTPFNTIIPGRPTNTAAHSFPPAGPSPSGTPTRSSASLGKAPHVIPNPSKFATTLTTRTASVPLPPLQPMVPSPTPSYPIGNPSAESNSALFTSGDCQTVSPPASSRSPPASEGSHDLPVSASIPISSGKADLSSTEGIVGGVPLSATSAMTIRPSNHRDLDTPSESLLVVNRQSPIQEVSPHRPLPRLPSSPSESASAARSTSTSLQQHRPVTSPDASRSISPAAGFIPSLSQIYPQELEYEHGVVLLSPPSSRSESPFSVVGGGVGSPFIGFSALGEGPNNETGESEIESGRSTPVMSPFQSPPGSSPSQYLSLPGSNAPSLPGSPQTLHVASQLEKSTYLDASYPHIAGSPTKGPTPSKSDPMAGPETPRTPTAAFDTDSDLSDWEQTGVTSPPRPAQHIGLSASTEPGAGSRGSFDDEDDLDAFSDSGLSEGSLSSWSSVTGGNMSERSSTGA